MENKEDVFGRGARERMKDGLNVVAEAVGATLGPKGRNAVIELNGEPVVTKDGVTVAKYIQLEDRLENMGAKLAIQTSMKTNDQAGDGTTTAMVLAQTMVNEGIEYLDEGVDAQTMRRGIERTVDKAVELLDIMSVSVTDLKHVASISANDPELGEMIGGMMEELGEHGVISVEKGQTTEMETEIVEGMHFEHGYQSPYLVTDVSRLEAVYEDIPVLLTAEVPKLNDIARISEMLIKQGKVRKLLIIANQMEDDVLRVLALNKAQGIFDCLAVRPPKYGRIQKEYLEDIGRLTGGTVVGADGMVGLNEISLDHLGLVKKVIAKQRSTTLIGNIDVQKEAVEERLIELNGQLEITKKKHDQDLLKERISKLTGGIGIIRVGASTEAAQKEKMDRVEDAVNATKAAMEEGIVPGGGISLLMVSELITEKLGNEESWGQEIVLKALRAPARRILENAGVAEAIIKDVMDKGKLFDSKKGDYVKDMVKAGIVDPTKVERCALQNAASIASMFLTTEVGIVEEPKEEEINNKK